MIWILRDRKKILYVLLDYLKNDTYYYKEKIQNAKTKRITICK